MKMKLSLSGLTGILYHFTQFDAAAKILATGNMVASPISGTVADQNASEGAKKKMFFLSTTTSRNGAYHRKFPVEGVLFTLDGRKLGQNYSGGPVDYWQYELSPKDKAHSDEMEERIYSDKALIPVKYITRADVLIDPKRKVGLDTLRKIKANALKHNIEVRIFNDPKQWLYGRKTATADIAEQVRPSTAPWTSNYRKSTASMISGAIEMLQRVTGPSFNPKNFPERLTKTGQYAYARIVRNPQDAHILNGEAQNAMRKIGTKERDKLDTLLALMKSHKFGTFKELTDHLRKRYSTR